MHDALCVGITQSIQQLADDFADFRQIKLGIVLQVVVQRASVDELHHDVCQILVFTVIVNCSNARMGQPADGLGLVAETRYRILQFRGIHR